MNKGENVHKRNIKGKVRQTTPNVLWDINILWDMNVFSLNGKAEGKMVGIRWIMRFHKKADYISILSILGIIAFLSNEKFTSIRNMFPFIVPTFEMDRMLKLRG